MRWLTVIMLMTAGAGAMTCQTRPTARTLQSSTSYSSASFSSTSFPETNATVRFDALSATAPQSSRVTGESVPTARTPTVVAPESLTWTWTDPELGSVQALVHVPEHDLGDRLGVLVALHGRAEALKGPARGARGYVDDYGLLTAYQWLSDPAVNPAPVSLPKAYRRRLVEALTKQPFFGMVVLMPYVPDAFARSLAFVNNHAYARVVRHFSARALSELPVDPNVERWALDGISLGGRVALVTGPLLADRFGTVGAIQAAVDEKELERLQRLMRQAQSERPNLHYSLVTSDQDYYREVLYDFHQALLKVGLRHEFEQLPGDHSYAFNRGPGVTHLLIYHDRRLNQRVMTK